MADLVRDREPPRSAAYLALPLGSVRPTGWLKRQLVLQAEGFTGHLGEVWPDVGPNSGWLGGTGEDWERGPYYCDGLVPLAYLLDDPLLSRQAQRWIDWTLQSQSSDGFFGPRTNDDWWPRMVMLKALIQHQEATDDPRVIPFLERYFAHQLAHLPGRPLNKWGRVRGTENLLAVYWLYRRTDDPRWLALADLLIAQTTDWADYFVTFPFKRKHTAGFDHLAHVVNVAMALKAPALRFVRTGEPGQRDAVYIGLANLDRYHGMATGMFSGDEWLAGPDPSQGVELCAVVELMFSLETLLRQLGDAAFGDRLERIAYNNLPATITADMRGRQYDQQPNQVLCTVARRNWTDNGDDSNVFGLEPNFGCCTANLHQGWPKLVAALWMATPDGGLAAAAYGPCRVATRIDGVDVTIDELTEYPFGGQVRFQVNVARPIAFPLRLRLPSWCAAPTVRVGGGTAEPVAGPGFATLHRTWRTGDVAELTLPARIEVRPRPSGGISVQRGPLTFALRVGEDWRQIPRGDRTAPFVDWEVYPATPWNYALALDPAHPEASLRLDRRVVGARPFDGGAPPLLLQGIGQRVPGWELVDNSAGPVPASPKRGDQPEEKITLIPYGCARLRVTELPLLNSDEG